MNVSIVDDAETARTSDSVARQRAEALSRFGHINVGSVIELCVGPSFETLSREYSARGIVCYGNDVDPRWRPKDEKLAERWLEGDALQLKLDRFDAAVFAPPLSRGCTGKREDALRADEVLPSYEKFLDRITWSGSRSPDCVVLVLPGRSLSTKRDREATYRIVNLASGLGPVSMQERVVDGVMKYLDLVVWNT